MQENVRSFHKVQSWLARKCQKFQWGPRLGAYGIIIIIIIMIVYFYILYYYYYYYYQYYYCRVRCRRECVVLLRWATRARAATRATSVRSRPITRNAATVTPTPTQAARCAPPRPPRPSCNSSSSSRLPSRSTLDSTRPAPGPTPILARPPGGGRRATVRSVSCHPEVGTDGRPRATWATTRSSRAAGRRGSWPTSAFPSGSTWPTGCLPGRRWPGSAPTTRPSGD
jgi:hypothetical protein